MLRNPEFGNVFRIHYSPILHRTMDGTLRYNGVNRPNYESFSVTITSLPRAVADSFIDYLANSAGQEIRMRDHENRVWTGFVTTNPVTVIRGARECTDQISFDFEGSVE